MFGVMSDYSEPIMSGGNCNENVHIANNDSFAGECMTNLCIIMRPVTQRKNSKSPFYLLGLFEMFFDRLTVKSTICKFCNIYLRGKYFISRSLFYMSINTSTMAEIFNPSVSIKNKSFHNLSIVKSYITIKRTTIIAMLHHLIILFSFL